MTATAKPARDSRAPVHFWPSSRDPGLQPGAILACGGPPPAPTISTNQPAEVTCLRCRSSRHFQAWSFLLEVDLERDWLIRFGFLKRDAPPALQRAKPYRNPELLDSRDPLENLARAWDLLAAAPPGSHGFLAAPLTGPERITFGNCAAELRAVLGTMRRGGL